VPKSRHKTATDIVCAKCMTLTQLQDPTINVHSHKGKMRTGAAPKRHHTNTPMPRKIAHTPADCLAPPPATCTTEGRRMAPALSHQRPKLTVTESKQFILRSIRQARRLFPGFADCRAEQMHVTCGGMTFSGTIGPLGCGATSDTRGTTVL